MIVKVGDVTNRAINTGMFALRHGAKHRSMKLKQQPQSGDAVPEAEWLQLRLSKSVRSIIKIRPNQKFN